MHPKINDQLRTIEWKDLTTLSRFDVVVEIFISTPWLFASLALAYYQYFLLAMPCSFMFFLTGLRQSHNAQHYTFGLSRKLTEWVMFVLSVIMLGSMHAVQVNHLRHHRFCLKEGDIEGMTARMPAWKALLVGPLFPLLLITHGLKYANRHQFRWIVAEIVMNVLCMILVFGFLDVSILKYHLFIMAVGQCFTGFFAVWTVHHHCEEDEVDSRTIRNPVLSLLTYNMFLHMEHHLFPRVPTCKLATLANRIDEVAPELNEKKVC